MIQSTPRPASRLFDFAPWALGRHSPGSLSKPPRARRAPTCKLRRRNRPGQQQGRPPEAVEAATNNWSGSAVHQIPCCLDPFSLQLRDILVPTRHVLEYHEDGQGDMTSMPNAHQLLLHLPHSQLRHWQQTTEIKHQEAPVQRTRSFPRNRTCRPEKRCSESSTYLVPKSS